MSAERMSEFPALLNTHQGSDTAAAILVIEQRLLSYNICHEFLILRSDNFSRLLHLPGLIVLVGI